jgi:hypothetical protein
MIKFCFLFFITFFLVVQSLWASSGNTRSFNVSAGRKQLSFEKKANFIWSNYCLDKKMGCARFRVSKKNKDKIVDSYFGFVKVVTDKLEKKDFEKYCKDVFDISHSNDLKLEKFVSSKNVVIPHCSWSGPKDETHFFWREGVTIVLTTTHPFDVEKVIREAKLNDLH